MELSPAAFNEIRKAVHDLCGIVIAEDKQYLVKSRLEPILKMNRLASYELLVQRLKQPNSLLLQDQIIEAITTNETSFNRRRPSLRGTSPLDPSRARESADRAGERPQGFLIQRLASGVRLWRPAKKLIAWRWP